MRKQLQGNAAGRLQLEVGWLSVVETVDNRRQSVGDWGHGPPPNNFCLRIFDTSTIVYAYSL